MHLYVARHGQTNYNDLGLCNADPQIDVHLTEAGIKQAETLADELKDIAIERIFVSELRRTQQTAAIVNTFHDAPVMIDARLNDNRSGYEGKHYLEYYAALDTAADKWSVRFNRGESLEDVKERVRGFLDELKSTDYHAVLVVTSMVIVQTMYGILGNHSNQEAWDLQVDKASCTRFEL